jgi:hypothetical protein
LSARREDWSAVEGGCRDGFDHQVSDASSALRARADTGVAVRVDLHGLQRAATATAVEALGAEHPLVASLDRVSVLSRQWLTAAGVLLAGTIGVAAGASWGALLVAAAAVVQLGLAVALAGAVGRAREQARDLIIDGACRGHVEVVAFEQRRLLSQRRRRALARGYERLLVTAERWPTILRSSRPVFDVRIVRAVAPELREIADRLGGERVSARGVALAGRLLCCGGSPLYGDELELLRGELNRIRTALEPERVAAVVADRRSQ